MENYTKLEKKIIEVGCKRFRKELEEASKPMLKVLKKYGMVRDHELLKKIKLHYPYGNDSFSQYAVNIPNDKELDSIHSKILDNFMNEVKEIKEKVNDLDKYTQVLEG